jgi:hypothetical protein
MVENLQGLKNDALAALENDLRTLQRVSRAVGCG